MVPERWRIKSLITSHLHHITTTSDIVVSTETENKATSFSFHDLLGSVLEPSKNFTFTSTIYKETHGGK